MPHGPDALSARCFVTGSPLRFRCDRAGASVHTMTDTDEAQFWMRRARSRWKITARLEALSILLLALLASIAANAHSLPGGPAQLGQAWVAVTAIGSLAAGVGTIVGAVAAVVAQRIAAKAEQTPGSHNAAGETS